MTSREVQIILDALVEARKKMVEAFEKQKQEFDLLIKNLK